MVANILFSQWLGNKRKDFNFRCDEKCPSEENIEAVSVYQEGRCSNFDIQFDEGQEDIDRIDVFINSIKIGFFQNSYGNFIFEYEDKNNTRQIFLLYNGFVFVSLKIFSKNIESYLYSKYFLILSNNKENNENIENMLCELNDFTDTIVYNQSIKISSSQKYSSIRGTWRSKALRSFDAYIKMIDEIISFFIKNYSFFKSNAYHKINHYQRVMDYEKARNFSQKEFLWLMKNADNFVQCNIPGSILIDDHHYFPIKILGEKNIKDRNVYENKIILAFLNEILFSISNIEENLSKKKLDVSKLQSIINDIQSKSEKDYTSSIATIKFFQRRKIEEFENKLYNTKINLLNILSKYNEILACDKGRLMSIPKRTKVFQEVSQYTEAYECIIKWINFGEFSLDQKNLLFNIKSVDVLYEYYCLIKLIKMFLKDGWDVFPNKDECSYYHKYSGFKYYYEDDLCNTYKLKKENNFLTIYYQPYIYTDKFENGLSLFRTTLSSGKETFYNPDFIVKVSSGKMDKYAIFDAKYSKLSSIKTYHLPDIIKKYYIETSEKSGNSAIKMILAFQGRMEDVSAFFSYSDSTLAKKYGPSFGVLAINTKENNDAEFLNEFSKRML